MDTEDVDSVVRDIAEEAVAEADEVAAEEAAKSAGEAAAGEAAKDAAEGAGAGAAKAADEASAEGAGGGPAGGTGKAPAEEEAMDDQPSSSLASGPGRYLKVGDDLFVHLLGAPSRAPVEGEVFDDEVLAATGFEVVDVPGAGGDGSPEEQLFRTMGANFRKLQVLYRGRLDKVESRAAAVDNAEADFKARIH